MQQMPYLSGKAILADLIGSDSLTAFNLLKLDSSFLQLDPSFWSQNASYTHAKSLFQSLNVVNDASERALGILTDFHTGKVTLDSEQKQILLKMVSQLRQTQQSAATSLERVTKKSWFILRSDLP